MSTVRKTTRSAQKKQSLKQNDTFKEIGTKILRTVMTVGFAMSSFIAQDVEAAGNGIVRVDGTTNLMQNGVANIYAEQVSGQVGLNRFQYFDVGSGQTANLYFNQAGSTNYVNTLVNTVQNRIDIGGTVNAIRNNKISGNLYFLSPQGMVIGAGGVVNAGSLTVLTPTQEAFSQYNSVANLDFVNTAGVRNDVAIPINASGTIEVHGTINAATAVELQAGKIDVSRVADSSINPVIKTGVVFDEIVNNNIAGSITNQKLQAQVDANGNVTFTDGAITGDGSIKLIATADKINDDTNKQVVASVNVGQGATIEAVGDVVLTVGEGARAAEAVHDGAGLTAQAGLDLHAVDGAFPLFQRIARLEHGDAEVILQAGQLEGGENTAGARADDDHIVLIFHNVWFPFVYCRRGASKDDIIHFIIPYSDEKIKGVSRLFLGGEISPQP